MKKYLSLIITLLLSVSVYALPGITQSIPDVSGQFVYYKDTSFERESYFGIIYYDEGTYGLRYFAPARTDVKPLLPKKDIHILFSLDSTRKYVELTGERILSAVTPEDTDIINYLHDMIYELSARRRKAGIIENTASIEQDYEQFGGTVTINFDSLIPLFNIKNINDSQGKSVFSLYTQGQLKNSQDQSFSTFEGLPLKTDDTTHQLELKKAKTKKISYTKEKPVTQKIILDSQWQAKAENLYMLSNYAVLALDVIDISAVNESEKEIYINTLKRKFNLGSEDSYPYSELTKISNIKNTQTFQNLFYNELSKSFTKDLKIITALGNDKYALMTLTVFQEAWSRNSKYFEKIIASYSVK